MPEPLPVTIKLGNGLLSIQCNIGSNIINSRYYAVLNIITMPCCYSDDVCQDARVGQDVNVIS